MALVGCTDLPDGWDGASSIADFSQSACSDADPYGETNERVEAEAASGAIAVDYLGAPFRCSQDVEGFFRTNGDAVDVLVQPVHMNPSSVAKCDCLYEIHMTVPVAPLAALTLYRRWDNINDPNDPVEIGSVQVAAE